MSDTPYNLDRTLARMRAAEEPSLIRGLNPNVLIVDDFIYQNPGVAGQLVRIPTDYPFPSNAQPIQYRPIPKP